MNITKYSFIIKSNKGFRAAFVADTHDREYKEIIDEIVRGKSDVIFLTGDIIYGHDDVADNGFKMLYDLAKTAPTYMSLGNHESNAVNLVRKHCFEANVTLLDNEYATFNGIYIGGLTSGYIVDGKGIPEGHWKTTPEPDVKWLEDFSKLNGYKLLLNHHPEYYPRYIKELDIDLTLSGHAHGGQWRFFGRGIFAPGQGLFPRYTSGLYENRLIVSRGLENNAFIPRLFNKYELIFIDFIKS